MSTRPPEDAEAAGKAAWQQKPERGVIAVTRFFLWLNLNVNETLGRLLLYPITAYFLLATGDARRASRSYLSLVLGRQARLTEVFRHYFTFCQMSLDRAFFLKDRLEKFQIEVHGKDVIDGELAKGKGCILLGAHFGSFEVMRALAGRRNDYQVKILMNRDNSPMIMAIMALLNPDLDNLVIPLGRPGAMLAAKQHLESGGMIGFLGDRIVKGDRAVRTEVLGQPADLPAGPMMLAAKLNVPVVFFCGLHRGHRRYEVHFELLAEQVLLDRSRREEDLKRIIDSYAARLGHFCRMAPYNWFNFYDFWDLSESQA